MFLGFWSICDKCIVMTAYYLLGCPKKGLIFCSYFIFFNSAVWSQTKKYVTLAYFTGFLGHHRKKSYVHYLCKLLTHCHQICDADAITDNFAPCFAAFRGRGSKCKIPVFVRASCTGGAGPSWLPLSQLQPGLRSRNCLLSSVEVVS